MTTKLKKKSKKKKSKITYATFPATAWSLVQSKDEDPVKRRARFQRLFETYRKPVLSVLFRYHKLQPADAEDLTQVFFTSILEKPLLEKFDPERGSFRMFLKVELADFVRKAWREEHSVRRGGKRTPLDEEPSEPSKAGDELDRAWVGNLIERAVEQARPLLAERGHERALEIFLLYDFTTKPATYGALARKFGITVSQVREDLRIARACIREIMEAMVRESVSTHEGLANELRFVFDE
jgi:RNA polymerase sigma factor (sigma-70 family)